MSVLQRTFRFAALLAVLLAALLVTLPAQAHSGNGRSIQARLDRAAQPALVVSAPAIEAGAAIGIGMSFDQAALDERADVAAAWLVRGLHVDAAGRPCAATVGRPVLIEGDEAARVSVQQRFVCAAGASLRLTDDSMLDAPPEHASIVSIAGSDTQHVLRGGAPTVELATAAWWATAGTFVLQGAIHLVTGYDHLLFVLSLMFAAGLLARREGFRKALHDVSVVVTAFTVGHSITLVMASLGLIVLSSQLVESVIAASIIVVAALNIVRPDTTVGRPWLALAFGLVHGFGFSSVLAEVGLPKGQHVMALLSFNVGIELAQLMFVALVLAPLAWLASKRFYKLAVMQLGSAAIALLAAVWLFERSLA